MIVLNLIIFVTGTMGMKLLVTDCTKKFTSLKMHESKVRIL